MIPTSKIKRVDSGTQLLVLNKCVYGCYFTTDVEIEIVKQIHLLKKFKHQDFNV